MYNEKRDKIKKRGDILMKKNEKLIVEIELKVVYQQRKIYF